MLMSRIISVREGKGGSDLLLNDTARRLGRVVLWGSLLLWPGERGEKERREGRGGRRGGRGAEGGEGRKERREGRQGRGEEDKKPVMQTG